MPFEKRFDAQQCDIGELDTKAAKYLYIKNDISSTTPHN